MKFNRNSPCHCGSGKKYKKCCLLKDKEQASKHLQQHFQQQEHQKQAREKFNESIYRQIKTWFGG